MSTLNMNRPPPPAHRHPLIHPRTASAPELGSGRSRLFPGDTRPRLALRNALSNLAPAPAWSRLALAPAPPLVRRPAPSLPHAAATPAFGLGRGQLAPAYAPPLVHRIHPSLPHAAATSAFGLSHGQLAPTNAPPLVCRPPPSLPHAASTPAFSLGLGRGALIPVNTPSRPAVNAPLLSHGFPPALQRTVSTLSFGMGRGRGNRVLGNAPSRPYNSPPSLPRTESTPAFGLGRGRGEFTFATAPPNAPTEPRADRRYWDHNRNPFNFKDNHLFKHPKVFTGNTRLLLWPVTFPGNVDEVTMEHLWFLLPHFPFRWEPTGKVMCEGMGCVLTLKRAIIAVKAGGRIMVEVKVWKEDEW
ncbi:hypothetical protein BZA05DRAFT_31927 [Tricharina praecox]|uniref:uncharacterized protein n=1 Tax=Tricharina praecox TaxID=43433 RepID=UPI00221E5FDA|nr:uncharacterized protein BZA05DRAFT_31927 [Tricharina praecox]KAI5853515.1 hypothetical protein BZA05DRAFT_31927 [Tricharina praecox]